MHQHHLPSYVGRRLVSALVWKLTCCGLCCTLLKPLQPFECRSPRFVARVVSQTPQIRLFIVLGCTIVGPAENPFLSAPSG
jgi:hypothetical protein